MMSHLQLGMTLTLAGFGLGAKSSTTPNVSWAEGGLTRDALVVGISNCTGKPGAIHAADSSTTGGGPTRVYCTQDTLALGDAIQVLQSVFEMAAWNLDGTTIWMHGDSAPALLLADAHRQRSSDMDGKVSGVPENPRGDVDLEGVSAEQAIRRIALAFDVAIVYSDESDPPGQPVSLALEGVDLDTCMALLVEQLDLRWSRLGSLVYLEPLVSNRDSTGPPVGLSRGVMERRERDSIASDSQEELAEARRLCVEAKPGGQTRP